jgi:NhaP-type Na+/H+ or K+/H+ antiporter
MTAVAGLGLTAGITSQHVMHQVQEFGETEGTQLILVVFLIFGLAMVPVAISLIGAKLDWQTITFIGWFGPRGIASVLYLLMAVAAIGFQGYEQVMSVIVLTVAISVYAHGISATPLSRRYGNSQSTEQG